MSAYFDEQKLRLHLAAHLAGSRESTLVVWTIVYDMASRMVTDRAYTAEDVSVLRDHCASSAMSALARWDAQAGRLFSYLTATIKQSARWKLYRDSRRRRSVLTSELGQLPATDEPRAHLLHLDAAIKSVMPSAFHVLADLFIKCHSISIREFSRIARDHGFTPSRVRNFIRRLRAAKDQIKEAL